MTATLAISSSVIAVIVVVLVLDLFAVVLAFSFIRARRAQGAVSRAAAGLPARVAEEPARKGPKPVTRREFFRQSMVASFMLFLAQFGGASIAFLWPNLKGGFGSVINAGTLSDIRNQIRSSSEPFYFGAGRFYIVPYDGSGVDEATGADYETDGVVAQGLMTLYQKCVHLGCRVPFCKQSQWFECPCHGSKYNRAGEYELGPAPRGMDRFRISVDGDTVLVDTSEIIVGPVRGTDTTGQSPEGPFCVGG
ncbi:MAG: Rieske 2Fe-2S domain-containing protein [Actinobacteria bacterium]|nr:Rieske 2Fe-2S domain-containing protein [Actinomycetota bacterium]